MDFVALDFETANASLRSICQVGMVSFRAGAVAETYSSLVNPDDYFDAINVSIHGITEADVSGAPCFKEIYPEILRRTEHAIVVCHTAFDRVALHQAASANALSDVSCRWLDTTRVVRRTWTQYAKAGYGLANLCGELGIAFQHHDAAEDARATGMVLLKAVSDSGLSLDQWFERVELGLDGSRPGRITRHGASEGELVGEVVVFTGALSIPRREAADMAAALGCEVEASVTTATSLLVVGDQDVARLAPGATKSSKHLKAEALIAKGQPIRILCETDFLQLLRG